MEGGLFAGPAHLGGGNGDGYSRPRHLGPGIDGGRVDVRLALTVAGCPLRASFQDQVAESVGVDLCVENVWNGRPISCR